MTITSRPSTPQFRENFDRIFPKKDDTTSQSELSCPTDASSCFFIGTDRECISCPQKIIKKE